ncbi:Hsp20/alpha crystallin family protein [Planctomicrobium sp. SH661]|uniref:Hsp20/alpha crystallin family protein n=1 Tax=Planctomicrobium sp. SH661 TaxID=3448124 RepID=UPI003F5C21DB
MTTTLPSRVSRGIQSWLRKNPIDNLREELDSLFNQAANDFDGGLLEGMKVPSMDLSETEKTFEVQLDVPGFKPEEVHVELQGDTLLIRGDHKEEKEEKGKTFHRIERRSGSIRRSIPLPAAVDQEKVIANCHDGVLTVTLPKVEACQAKKIPVNA